MGQAKAGGSPSSEALPEVTPLIGRKPGGWLWKPASKVKANEEGDSGVERSRECSYRLSRLQKLGRRIFPGRA